LKILIITSEWPTEDHPEWVPFLKDQVDDLRRLGLQVDVFNFRGNSNPFKYLLTWIKFQFMDKKSYDIFHAHWGQNGLICFPSKKPVVVTYHGSDLQGIVKPDGHYDQFRSFVLRIASKISARLSSRIILVSGNMQNHLPKVKNKTDIIPCGIDLEKFTPIEKSKARQMLKWPLDKKFVLFPANPEFTVKRFQLATEVVEWIRNDFNVELITLSSIPHDLVPYYMNASDVLLMTSKHEGSPMVIKEALACNLPIVSVNVGDVKERISSIPGCEICDTDYPDEISEKLKLVLERGLRIDGRSKILDLSRKEIAKKIVKIYQDMIN